MIIQTNLILAIKEFCDTKSNDWKSGVLFEIAKDETRMVASDGHILGCARVGSGHGHDYTINAVIKAEVFRTIKQDGLLEVKVGDPINGRSRHVEIMSENTVIKCESLDCKYPDYKKVIPDTVSGEIAIYDVRYMAKLAKVWSILYGKKSLPLIGISYNGEKPALINIDANFFAVLAPLRTNAVEILNEPPKWAK